jgi:uncharacterized metal-binding protein YceD (DUF177 family)
VSDAAPEFSRLVPLTRLGPEPFRQDIAASEDERAALARRLGLVSLDRLAASVELARESGGIILLRAEFTAAFAQDCVVSLEPMASEVSERFALRYGPPEAEPGAAAAIGDDEPAFELLPSDAIDIGEAVAQEFSLALPPFPRDPEAVIEADAAPEPEDSPFAALRRVVARREE